MPTYQCKNCRKCLATKQTLQKHENRKKPCVAEELKTKFQCNRCLKYVSSKRRLTEHRNRKNKCVIYRNIVVIPTEFEKEIDLVKKKDKMITEMNKEYNKELLKCYKSINNPAIRIKKREKLIKALAINIRTLKTRKTIPEKIPSVVPKEKKLTDKSDKLIDYYRLLKKRIEKAEKKISSLQEIHEDTILGINSILDDLSTDRDKVYKIQKELKLRCDIHLLSCMIDIEEEEINNPDDN